MPISHTCFKTIEIPIYPTYEHLKKKLNIAFTNGLEGFGIVWKMKNEIQSEHFIIFIEFIFYY